MSYINKELLAEMIEAKADTLIEGKEAFLYIRKWLDLLPTADVEEVRHGEWYISSDGYYPYCDNCKTEPKNGVLSKFCPECGAKMDGKNRGTI